MPISSIIVIDVDNQPVIFLGATDGRIMMIQPNKPAIVFGAHNDNLVTTAEGKSICNLFKISNDLFLSLGKDGILREWNLE